MTRTGRMIAASITADPSFALAPRRTRPHSAIGSSLDRERDVLAILGRGLSLRLWLIAKYGRALKKVVAIREIGERCAGERGSQRPFVESGDKHNGA